MKEFFNFKLNEVADVVRIQMKIFNCSIDIAWRDYIHDIIKEQITFEQVKQVINDPNEEIAREIERIRIKREE